ncbi:hypothetical protein BDF19DRAFT_424942 [Syncephalis fuscata]|nr:hypothetical protein BDF19DRAFT_424942 [Syncephalis fuscata]
MYPTLRCAAAIIAPKPHVPLIHFIGKRSLLAAHQSSGSDNNNNTAVGGEKKAHNVISYSITADELPKRFRFQSISLEEMEAVETGGATHLST